MRSTGITTTCGKCKATNVPMRWNFRPYAHAPDREWNTSANWHCPVTCEGETSDRAFDRMLRNAELALAGEGYRLMTDTEISDRTDAHSNGHLF